MLPFLGHLAQGCARCQALGPVFAFLLETQNLVVWSQECRRREQGTELEWPPHWDLLSSGGLLSQTIARYGAKGLKTFLRVHRPV